MKWTRRCERGRAAAMRENHEKLKKICIKVKTEISRVFMHPESGLEFSIESHEINELAMIDRKEK